MSDNPRRPGPSAGQLAAGPNPSGEPAQASLYFDYAATTPVDARVVAAMQQCLGLDGVFANPASQHGPGEQANALVNAARRQIAERIGAQADEIFFTSGATESNNLVIKGCFPWDERVAERPRRFATCKLEHKSVLDCAAELAARGVEICYVPVNPDGRVDLAALESILASGVRLLSIMHVNNEIGVSQDLAVIADMCARFGALLHTDVAQSVGKVPLDLNGWGVQFCSLTAHKICGPKGIGAVYIQRGARLEAQMHGGAQEQGFRSGTLATHQIVGMGLSYALADPAVDGPPVRALSDRLLQGLRRIDGVERNGADSTCIPNIMNLCFPGIEGDSLRHALGNIAVSAGSACNSAVPEPSYVLRGIGLSDVRAASSVRFSIGRFTTAAEVDEVVRRVTAAVGQLRQLADSAPSWCSA